MPSGRNIVVRKAYVNDLEDVLGLYTEFYTELRRKQGFPVRNRDDYRAEVKSLLSKNTFLLAEEDSHPIGFARISVREGAYWIEELYVKPEHRGRGVARRLVEEAEKYIGERDSHAYIMVLPQDRRAMGFWLHMGYRIMNTVELAKKLKGGNPETRRVLFLSDIMEIYRWVKEEYTPLEGRFLELIEEASRRGLTGKDILRIIVESLEKRLS